MPPEHARSILHLVAFLVAVTASPFIWVTFTQPRLRQIFPVVVLTLLIVHLLFILFASFRRIPLKALRHAVILLLLVGTFFFYAMWVSMGKAASGSVA